MARRSARTATSRDAIQGLQLGLALDVRPPELFFRREREWPRAAPSPRLLTPVANRLGLLLRERLNRHNHDVDRLTITASASQWAQTRREGHAYSVDLHWRALDEVPLTLASLLAAVSGAGFPRSFSERMSELVGPDDVYARRRTAAEARVSHNDLDARLLDVARHLPDPAPAAVLTIGWGRTSGGSAGRSIRLGVMRTREKHIVVHPVLDQPSVPSYVLDGVVFHELCHWVAPPLTAAEAESRRDHRVHHREFRALESCYPLRDQADTWIRENLTWILANA
jgi:hypothetical protein